MCALSRARRMRTPRRWGATAVEVAVVLPVFLSFVFAVFEFGRLQLVSNLLTSATRAGARYGATEGVTSAQARSRVLDIVGAGVDASKVAVIVKDASVYDGDGPYPNSLSGFQSLPGTELSTLDPRGAFLVHASVNYNDVAILPFTIFRGITLSGRAVMRHE